MKQYLASEDRELFEGNGLASFEALWSRALPAVDQPNTDRGGWSAVFRLELEGRGYYVKRQCNHQIRTLRHPFGERPWRLNSATSSAIAGSPFRRCGPRISPSVAVTRGRRPSSSPAPWRAGTS